MRKKRRVLVGSLGVSMIKTVKELSVTPESEIMYCTHNCPHRNQEKQAVCKPKGTSLLLMRLLREQSVYFDIWLFNCDE